MALREFYDFIESSSVPWFYGNFQVTIYNGFGKIKSIRYLCIYIHIYIYGLQISNLSFFFPLNKPLMVVSLKKCFSKCGPQKGSISIIWELARNVKFCLPPQIIWIWNYGREYLQLEVDQSFQVILIKKKKSLWILL